MTENDQPQERLPDSFEYLIKEDAAITPDIVDQIKAFAKKEFSEYQKLSQIVPLKDLDARRNASYNHNGSVDALEEYLGKYSVQLIMAKKNEAVVGYSLSIINPQETDESKKVGLTYIGVGWEQQGKGIGKELMRKRLQLFREKNIKQFSTKTWPRSESLYEQLKEEMGITYSVSKENNFDKITVHL